MQSNQMKTNASNKHYHSDIPPGAQEREVKHESCGGPDRNYRAVELILNGQVVGKREYNESGILILEEPIRDGCIHGTIYWWSDEGFLEFLEPYHEGLMHGTAIQFDPAGNVVGTYTMVHGTGFDIWRNRMKKVFGVWPRFTHGKMVVHMDMNVGFSQMELCGMSGIGGAVYGTVSSGCGILTEGSSEAIHNIGLRMRRSTNANT